MLNQGDIPEGPPVADTTAEFDAIFCAAVEITSANERAEYLRIKCAGDEILRLQLQQLVDAHFRAGSFLELPVETVQWSNEPPIQEAPGTKIGRYKLLEQIGEGGFGVVFMAEQEEPVRRRVALKIIKAGMDTRQVVARFEAERQALAMMDHPNIARVFDAGATNTGRPYFVMELVKGISITTYCDQHKLNTDARLKLFIAVCSAVQHAHQKGIIHRDLKPSNVLVTMHDDKPVPKIIDFGIAKATLARLTDKTLFTEFRQLIGTPAYMSPEQAQMIGLDVDTRSDIYSLGVLLYELLTGTTPIDSKELLQSGYDEMRRIIREVEPPSPSTRLSTLASSGTVGSRASARSSDPKHLCQQLRGDLDWIVMKCLEKDRSRRYETTAALAADVERYLSDEPVEARRPTRAYRLKKFVRRNRAGVLTASAILVSLTAATVVSTWLYVREREARRQTEIGSTIFDAANAFRSNSQEEAELALASLTQLERQMDAQNRAKLYYRLGDLRARQGLWKVSAEFYAKGVEQQPDPLFFEPWHYYLPALVRSGNVEDYHSLRREVLRRFSGTSDPRTAECALKDCLITPWPDANFDELERLADTAMQAEDHWAWNHFQFAKALLEYRRANYESAMRYTRQVVTHAADFYLIIPVTMVRAMALHQLGDAEGARRELSSGLEFAQATLRREAHLTADRLWHDWVIAHALMDEAAALIDPELAAQLPKSLATLRHPAAAVDNLFLLALEELRSGDEAGYRQACAVLALVPDDSGNTVSEFRRLWAWCLGSHPAEDLQVPMKHAEELVAGHSLNASYAEQLVLGAMHYRMGEYESAEGHLKASIAAYPDLPPIEFHSNVYPKLILSMVQSRLGRQHDSDRLLVAIDPAIKAALDNPATPWEYRAIVELLSREASFATGLNRLNTAPQP